MPNTKIGNFPVTVYGNLEKYSDVISKGRCRIFYKGANRNSTFITDEFAEKLLKSIPYTPVKGIYDSEEKDFTDHGASRTLGRIYGVVPQDPNFAWEKHLDEDGVEREYACVDVLYYTGLYGEAGEISGKSQSMELYAPSIKGDWKILNGKRFFVYSDGCFLGLQALGTDVEPCFEGAAFYNLIAESMKKYIEEVETYNKNNFQNSGSGGQKMFDLFKLSDAQKECALWDLLNSETDADGYRKFNYAITAVYDEYAVAFNYEANQYERIYYTKDDATDSLEITNKVKCYIVDVTESEKAALDTIRKLNGETYEKADEVFASVETLRAENSELSTKNTELNDSIATLTTERDDVSAQLTDAQASLATLQTSLDAANAEKDALAAYKKNIEDSKKLAVIESYAETVPEDVLETYKSNLDSYTCEDLDMRLTYEQKKSNPDMFARTTTPVIPTDMGSQKSGIELILARYEKK